MRRAICQFCGCALEPHARTSESEVYRCTVCGRQTSFVREDVVEEEEVPDPPDAAA